KTLNLPIKLPLVGFKRKTGGMMVAQLSGQNLAKAVGAAHFKPLSLFTISEAELVPYTRFYARRVLQPSIPLLRNTSIDVVLSGDDIQFQKSFDAQTLPAPAPIKITGGGILISAGTDGFQIGGTLNVALGTVATGSISAAVDTNLNFSLCGSIDFDST